MNNNKPLILIVDDNPQNVQILGKKIEQNGYDTAIAMNGAQALNYVKHQEPDLILLDIIMPEMDGFEVCQILKTNPITEEIPLIFLTACNGYDDISKAFEIGAVDYITKPFNLIELNARIKTHLELKKSRETLKCYNEQLESTNKELKDANEIISQKNLQLNEAMSKLKIAAKTDPLTGLLNRRCILEKIDLETIRFRRNGKRFSLALGDLDNFKNINDRYGHDCGDYVLKSTADLMKYLIREQDSLARWGGEEFLLLLPETDMKGAKTISEKISERIQNTLFQYKDIRLSLTITFGVTEFDSASEIDASIKNADIALYNGKNNGRNRVVVY